jgi:predicted lipoprotein with Yx(FWY)xxD motif
MIVKLGFFVILSLSLLSVSVVAYTIGTYDDQNGNLYLINQEGRTLYYFANDPPYQSTCFGSCSETWPPFYASLIDVPSTLNKADFSYLSRSDGLYQTTYMGKPLYIYSGDNSKGERNGDGNYGLWFVARP